jgi:hypothetical protein
VAPEPPFGGSSAYNAGFGGEKLTIGLHTNDIPTVSGGVSFFDCTVGTGGDYATVLEAHTAGKRNALLISDVTEVASSSGLSGMTIVGNLSGTSQTNAPFGCFSPLRTWLMYYTGGSLPLLTVKNINIDNVNTFTDGIDTYSYGATFSGCAENCSYLTSGAGSPKITASRCSITANDYGRISFSEFYGCYINLIGTKTFYGSVICSIELSKIIGCQVIGTGRITNQCRVVGSDIGCHITSLNIAGSRTSYTACRITSSATGGWGTHLSSCTIDITTLPSYSCVTGCTMGNMTGTTTNCQVTGCICGTINITGTNCIIVANQTGGLTVGGTGNVVANNI